MYFVYILVSKVADKTYTGITIDTDRRLRQHNLGLHFYTKRYKPWKIIYTEKANSRAEVRIREKYFKSAAGRIWMEKNIF